MDIAMSSRAHLLVVLMTGALVGIQSAASLAGRGPEVLFWVCGYAVAAFLLSGPLAWFVRRRTSAERRETLQYVLVGPLFLALLLLVGVELATGLLQLFDAAVLGGLLGLGFVVLVELIAVPEKLRSPETRQL